MTVSGSREKENVWMPELPLLRRKYRQFIDYVATRNQVNISNLNAIQRFTDTESHPDFIFRFTLSMPIVNTYSEPYLCIRKVPKSFPMMTELVEKEMLDRNTAELLVQSSDRDRP